MSDTTCAGQPNDGLREYHEAVRLEPQNLERRFALADALERLGRIDEAIPAFQEAVRIAPQDALVRCRLASALILGGRIDEGIAVYREALRLDPGVLEEKFQDPFVDPFVSREWSSSDLEERLVRAGRIEDAITLYQETARLAPDAAEIRVRLARVLLRAERREEAIAEYRAALSIDPSRFDWDCQLSLLYRSAGRHVEAITILRERVRRDPDYDYLGWFCALAESLENADRMAEALCVYREAASVDPADPWGYARLGSALIRSGLIEEGIAEYEAALRLDPDGIAVLEADVGASHWLCQMADSLAEAGAVETARLRYQQAIDLWPDDYQPHRGLARIWRQTGRTDEAVAAYRDALRLEFHAPELWNELGVTLNRAGRRSEARAAWEHAATLGDEEIAREASRMLEEFPETGDE